MHSDMNSGANSTPWPSLPKNSYLPINRCNLPAAILGGLSFQQHPVALLIDGVAELHRDLWHRLDRLHSHIDRATQFMDYMTVHFLLHEPEEAGYDPRQRNARLKMDYRQLLRGWMFDADNREGAVLKGWVESRFGLIPCWHRGPVDSAQDDTYRFYLHQRTSGIYNTNALEAQMDLLYTYCQYELTHQHPEKKHIQLFRGMNSNEIHHAMPSEDIMLFNNLNACSLSQERADEFGSLVYSVQVPCSKILYYSGLLPGILQGEDEYLVIGGLYQTQRITL